MKAQLGSRGTALLFLGTRQGWVVNATPQLLYSPGNRPSIHCTGGWMGPRAGLDGCRRSHPPTGIRSPDHPVHSELPYQLHYPGPHKVERVVLKHVSWQLKILNIQDSQNSRLHCTIIISNLWLSLHQCRLIPNPMQMTCVFFLSVPFHDSIKLF
jgi:hypothetical protein